MRKVSIYVLSIYLINAQKYTQNWKFRIKGYINYFLFQKIYLFFNVDKITFEIYYDTMKF